MLEPSGSTMGVAALPPRATEDQQQSGAPPGRKPPALAATPAMPPLTATRPPAACSEPHGPGCLYAACDCEAMSTPSAIDISLVSCGSEREATIRGDWPPTTTPAIRPLAK